MQIKKHSPFVILFFVLSLNPSVFGATCTINDKINEAHELVSALETAREEHVADLLRKHSSAGENDFPQLLRGKSGKTSVPSKGITRSNVLTVFKEPIENVSSLGSGKGAKAIVYRDIDGKLKAIFWDTWEVINSNNVHHRDAVAGVIARRAQLEGAAAERAGAKANESLNAAEKDAAVSPTHLDSAIQHDKDQAILTAAAARHAKMAREVGGESASRSQSDMPHEVMNEMQGFQLAARTYPNGATKVVRFAVASSITSAQVANNFEIKVDLLVAQIKVVNSAIDPSLRSYRKISITREFHDTLVAQGKLHEFEDKLSHELGLDVNELPKASH